MSSNIIHNAKPFALDVKHSRFGAEGMDFPKAVGEKIDDAFDANGNPRWKVIHTPEKDMMVLWNMGENCSSLQRLLGLSSVIKRKEPNNIGLMNKGSFSALCHWEPTYILLFSRNEDGKMIELTFQFGKYLAALDACHENYRDPSLDPNKYLDSSKISMETDNYLKRVATFIQDPVLKKEFESIFSQAPQFFGAVLEFNPTHRLYGKLDQEFEDCIPLMNFYHGKILRNRANSSIAFENYQGVCKFLDKKTAVDLFYGYKCVKGDVEVRRIKRVIKQKTKENKEETKELIEDVFKVILSVDGFPQTDEYFITNQPKDAKFNESQPLRKMPSDWDKMTKLGDFKVRLTCLSINDDHKQRKEIGGEYEHNAELARGIMVSWNERYLGEPWWPETPQTRKAHYGAKCNAGPLRIEVDIQNSHALIEMAKVQTDKGKVDLTTAHPCLLRLLDGFMTLAKTFSSTKKSEEAKKDKNWRPTWNPEEVFFCIGGKPKEVVAHPNPTPNPKANPTPNPKANPTPNPTPNLNPNPVVNPEKPKEQQNQVLKEESKQAKSSTASMSTTSTSSSQPTNVFSYRKGKVAGQELVEILEELLEWIDPDETYTDKETIELFNTLHKYAHN